MGKAGGVRWSRWVGLGVALLVALSMNQGLALQEEPPDLPADPQGDPDEDEPLDAEPDEEEGADEEDVVARGERGETGEEEIVILLPDGTLVVIWKKNKNRYDPDPEGGVIEIEDEEVARSEPIPGDLVDFESFHLPLDVLPPDVLAPWPDPGADGWDDEERGEHRRRVDLDEAEGQRVVVITQEVVDGEVWTVIRVYDGMGKLLKITRIRGTFVRAIYNKTTGEKVIIVERDGLIHWVLINTQTGEASAQSQTGRPEEELDPDEIVDIEVVGDRIIITDRWRGGQWIRVRIYTRNGVELYHTLYMPGEFVAARAGEGGLKAFVTTKDGTVYQDIVHTVTGTQSNPAGPQGIAENGIDGEHMHIQCDKSLGLDRFIEVVYNRERDETTVRIIDVNGRIVRTHVFKGKFSHVRRVDPPAGAEDTVAPWKYFAITVDGWTELWGVDLNTGEKRFMGEKRGTGRRVIVDPSGKVDLGRGLRRIAMGGADVPGAGTQHVSSPFTYRGGIIVEVTNQAIRVSSIDTEAGASPATTDEANHRIDYSVRHAFVGARVGVGFEPPGVPGLEASLDLLAGSVATTLTEDIRDGSVFNPTGAWAREVSTVEDEADLGIGLELQGTYDLGEWVRGLWAGLGYQLLTGKANLNNNRMFVSPIEGTYTFYRHRVNLLVGSERGRFRPYLGLGLLFYDATADLETDDDMDAAAWDVEFESEDLLVLRLGTEVAEGPLSGRVELSLLGEWGLGAAMALEF